MLLREQNANRAEMERLRASETAKDTEMRSELVAIQQSAGSLRRQLDASTPFIREPPNFFRTSSEPVRGMHPPTNLPSYSAANVGTPTIGQQENRGSGLGSDRSRDGYWTGAGSTYDIGRPLDHSQLNPLQAMYGAKDRLKGGATQQSSATTLTSYSYTRGVGLPACQRSRFTHSTRLSAQQIATNRVLQFGNR